MLSAWGGLLVWEPGGLGSSSWFAAVTLVKALSSVGDAGGGPRAPTCICSVPHFSGLPPDACRITFQR